LSLSIGVEDTKRVVLAGNKPRRERYWRLARISSEALWGIVVDLLKSSVGSCPACECQRTQPDEDDVIGLLFMGVSEWGFGMLVGDLHRT
jgi:hypothetical protein